MDRSLGLRHAFGLAASLSALACSKSAEPPPTETREPRSTAVAPASAVGATPPPSTASAPVVAASATALAERERPADDDVLVVPASAAGSARGFRISGLRGHGWSRSGSDGRVLVTLSGPPGGPLGFEVRASSAEGAGSATLEKQFAEAVTHRPSRAGRPEKVRLAGAEREAQAFRTGEGLATTSWCAVRVPGAPGRAGLLVLASTGGRGDAEPTCEASLRHEAIAPLVASFALE